MSLLIESIKLNNGRFSNLFYHEQRINHSLETLFSSAVPFDLHQFVGNLEIPPRGLFKCRIVYDSSVREVEFIPYQAKAVKSLQVVHHARISYPYKFQNRRTINKLYDLRNNCDDILIVKNEYITDSSSANIVFRKDKTWFTPRSALLKGTMRQNLLEQQQIEEADIKVEDIKKFDTFRLINAMIEFNAPEIDVSNIVL